MFVLDQLNANNYEENGLCIYGKRENSHLVSFILNQGDNLSYFAQDVRDVTPFLEELRVSSSQPLLLLLNTTAVRLSLECLLTPTFEETVMVRTC